jgi:acyl-CoA dehydrogenase
MADLPPADAALLAARVDEFVRNIVAPYERDPRMGDHGPSDGLIAELRAKTAAVGLIAPHLPAEWGGHGLSNRGMAAVFKAAGFSPLGPIAMNIQAPDEGNMHLLEQVANEAQKRRYLAPLVEGRVRSAFLMTEPDGGAGSDPSMIKTRATRAPRGWRINGRKTFATGADGADFAIVMAETDGGATMFLVPMNSPGIKFERILETLDRSMPGGHAVITLADVEADEDSVLGEVDQGFRYAQVRLAPARLTHCMRWWGLAKRAHDVASAHACRRRAFGKVLIDHEGVGFMLADNEIDLLQSSLLIDWCADALDAGKKGTGESSIAKVAVSEALFRIADRCVQIFGGTGITTDTIVEQAFREFRAFRIYDGPSEVHRWSIANKLKRNVMAANG